MLDEMLQRMYDFTLWVVTISQRFAKVHKYSLG